jgi:pimeloyl-ACP methyl ester carboxylesterase
MGEQMTKIKHSNLWIFILQLSFILILLVSCSHNPSKEELEALYAPAPSKFIVINNTRIHYRDEGTGPTIVLIHGVLASLHTWDAWTLDLKRDHRVIRFDVPAFGLTGKIGNDEYDLENYMIIMDKFFKEINVPEHFVIVGNSLGGYLAWNYAVKYPNQITKLALLDAGAYPQELPSVITLMIAPIIRSLPASFTPEFMIKKNVESVYGDPSRIKPGVLKLYRDINLYPGTKEASVKLFQNLKTLINQEPVLLKKLKMPTLVMWGEKDIWVPFNKRWKEDLPNATYIFYPGVGHVPMEEIPEQSVADFRKWL